MLILCGKQSPLSEFFHHFVNIHFLKEGLGREPGPVVQLTQFTLPLNWSPHGNNSQLEGREPESLTSLSGSGIRKALSCLRFFSSFSQQETGREGEKPSYMVHINFKSP